MASAVMTLSAAGCGRTVMTHLECDIARLEVGGTVHRRQFAVAMHKPGVHYNRGAGTTQVMIKVRIAKTRLDDLSIMNLRWWLEPKQPTKAASIRNTTRSGGLMFPAGISFGGRTAGGGTGAAHPAGCTCPTCGSVISRPSIEFPLAVPGRKGGGHVTSAEADFKLDENTRPERGYLVVDLKTGVADNGNILARSILVPLIVVPKGMELPERQPSAYVTVRENQTLAVGGSLKLSEAEAKRKAPVLHNLPMLGRMFKSSNKTITKQDLLIFITPKVVLTAE